MKYILKLMFVFSLSPVFSQDSSTYGVYLIGDAGDDTVPGKALLMLQHELENNPHSSTLFLGDNVYPSGLIAGDKVAALHLESQLKVLQAYKGNVFFIPGNHDWNSQKRNGLKTLKTQEIFVEDYLKTKTTVANKNTGTFLPKNGLPGPETVLLNAHLRLIIIDSQWFLHAYKKNTIGTKKHTEDLFYIRLDSILKYSKINKELVIVAAHHPLYTNGQHAKTKQPFRFLVNCTPFQLFGLLGINRLYSQDMAQPRYRKMRKKMLEILNSYQNITYVSGHEHNLQCFKEKGNRFIVSGSGSKHSKLLNKKKFNSIFQDDSKTGFIKINYSIDRYISTTIYRVGEQEKVLDAY
jgi:predicted phosphodiesterase